MSDTLVSKVPPASCWVAPEAEVPTTVDGMAEPAIGPVRVGPKGRVVLPAEARRQLGLNESDELCVLVEDGMIKLMTPDRLTKLIQDMAAHYEGSLVEDLLAERRRDIELERRGFEEGS